MSSCGHGYTEKGMVSISEILEACMVVCFGISWPLSIVKSYRARSTKGKSLLFLLFILVGYVCGIVSKLVSHNISYVFVFYIINFIMVSLDVILYFRNKGLQSVADASGLADAQTKA